MQCMFFFWCGNISVDDLFPYLLTNSLTQLVPRRSGLNNHDISRMGPHCKVFWTCQSEPCGVPTYFRGGVKPVVVFEASHIVIFYQLKNTYHVCIFFLLLLFFFIVNIIIKQTNITNTCSYIVKSAF